MKQHNWKKVSQQCKEVNIHSRERLLKLFNTQLLCKDESKWIGQMSSIILPQCNSIDFYQYLKSKNIEVPIIDWHNYQILRISIQAYNTSNDINRLIKYIKKYFNL